ncbi:MAG: TCR/Tet family MFS transporter [Planctomycetota bacterium]
MQNTSRHRPGAIVFILLLLLIDILGIGLIIPVLPELVKELLDADPDNASAEKISSLAGRYVGWIGAVYAIMQFFFSPILGGLSDRFGRRPVLLLSMLGLGIDFIVVGLAPSLSWLFVARAISGVMGASLTTGNAYIADISDEENRARNFGLVGVMFGIGFTLGPTIGGLLGAISLRLPFFVAAGLALANFTYGYFRLPESLPPEKRSKVELWKLNPVASIGSLGAYPLVAALAVVFVLKSFAQRGLENVWVLYTAYKFEWSSLANGLALGMVGIMAIVVQGGLVKPVIKRFGPRKTIVAATLISATAFAGYGLANQTWMIPWIIVFGSLGGLAGPAIQSLVTSTVDESNQGRVQGAITSLTSITAIAAPLFFNSFLFSFFVSEDAPIPLPGAPLLVGSLLQLMAAVIAFVIFLKRRDRPTPAMNDLPESAS